MKKKSTNKKRSNKQPAKLRPIVGNSHNVPKSSKFAVSDGVLADYVGYVRKSTKKAFRTLAPLPIDESGFLKRRVTSMIDPVILAAWNQAGR